VTAYSAAFRDNRIFRPISAIDVFGTN